MPSVVAEHLRALVHDYEDGDSLEVRCAHDADKLEPRFQAIDYRDTGHQNVGGWIESSREATDQVRPAPRGRGWAMSSQEWDNAIMRSE